jgi:cell division protease FtsH
MGGPLSVVAAGANVHYAKFLADIPDPGPGQIPLAGKEYSEATAGKLDEEVKDLITERAAGVRDLFSQNRGLLEEVAGELLKKEVMDSDGFYRLADNHRPL